MKNVGKYLLFLLIIGIMLPIVYFLGTFLYYFVLASLHYTIAPGIPLPK